jgi:hypothetical protein
LMDIHKKKIPTTSVLDRNAAMRFMGIPDNSPTLSPPTKAPEAVKEPELPPVVVDELPEDLVEKEVLSEDDIAKLLGDR